MRATVLTLIAAATLATAQSGSIPTCAQTCISQALPGNCNLDPKCICADASFISTISCCVSTACDVTGQQAALSYAKQICAPVGVTNLPTAASCAGPASASSSGTSAAAVATASGSSASSALSSASKTLSSLVSSASSIASSASKSASSAAASGSSSASSSASSASSSASSASRSASSAAASASSSASSAASKSTNVAATMGPMGMAGVAALGAFALL
ncbi:hypothetical protein E4T50_02677 [Aureobasidium sp. EXF-12298]|nr:hypothetical protein E4T50_02677 [Aureobasidium sp. EXF-12298]KAI4762995.1 hypothetical protein E4T51_03982 [Aureobasidium sp. EXF-12344]KAI4782042.1 hypothetical protein E4T52_03043 [Aureobasidium sp. EXF-3400]